MNPLLGIILASLIVGAGATTYVAHDAGYIPVKELMETEEPVGYQPVCKACIEHKYQSILDEVPNLDKIKYEVYISSLNHLEIIEDYQDKLTKDEYKLETSGVKTLLENIEIYYYGFLKGITAVGILITSGENIGYPEATSVVLYTTGNVLDYQEIINWYKTNGLSGIE